MIDVPAYKLRPPLRKPAPTTVSEVATAPGVSASRIPPLGSKGLSTANSRPGRMFFCSNCGKRAVGRVPCGWVRILRSVHPDSLSPSCLLVRHDRKGRPKYADLMLGMFCCADCMERALTNLIESFRDLDAREVGMRPLGSGEKPPDCRL